MNLYKTILITLWLCFFVLMIDISANDTNLTMQPDCRTFYADREHTFTITANNAVGEALNWNLHYAGRTLAAGKQTIPDNGVEKIKFEFPKLNEGVVAETEFSCWIGEQALGIRHEALGSKTDAPAPSPKEIRKRLYFFNPNPFEDQKKALEQAQIGIWETGANDLSELLKSLEVPFAKVAAPEQFSGKILLVSGLDLNKAPGALEACLKQAERGKRVIILPPMSGKVLLPFPKLDGFKLGKNDLIKNGSGIRAKLDYENWNGEKINRQYLNLISKGETIELGITDDTDGFSFCELRRGKGKVTLITWEIIKEADNSPTPVYLLKEMLFKD